MVLFTSEGIFSDISKNPVIVSGMSLKDLARAGVELLSNGKVKTLAAVRYARCKATSTPYGDGPDLDRAG